MAADAMLKITKIAIYPQRFDRSLQNLVRWCKMDKLQFLVLYVNKTEMSFDMCN